MKITREQINDKKTYLGNALTKIEKTFESLENSSQYQGFFNLCNNVSHYCNHWSRAIAPNKFVYYISKKRRTLYNSFQDYSLYIVEQMQSMIDQFKSGEEQFTAQQKRQQDLEERMRMEYEISKAIKEDEIEEIRNSHKILGFAKYATGKKQKRKYTKKK